MSEKNKKNNQFLKGIALVAAIFAGLVCLLVIANYFQISRIDPVNTEIINQLVDRLQDNPNDTQLRSQIRELDLLARKAYFTNQWQVKTGGYLILLGLAVFVLAYQILEVNVKKQVMVNPDAPKDILGIQKNARIGISLVGGSLVLIALLMTFLTYNKLGQSIGHATLANAEKAKQENAGTTIVASVVASVSAEPIEDPALQEVVEPEVKKSIAPVNEPIVTKQETVEETNKKESSTTRLFLSEEQIKKNAISFRGFYGTGVVYQDNVPQTWNGATNENIVWKTAIPIQGYNSPIVWEDKIFLTGANEAIREVYCFEKASGKLLWQTKIENIPGSPEKPPKTTADTGLGAPTMTTDGKRVYAIFGTGDVVALNMNGKMVWGKNLGVPKNHYGHSSSLIMHNDKLIVQYDQKTNPKILALAATTGEEVWSTPRKVKISWASPIIIEHQGKSQVILASDPLVASYDPETGKELWSLDCIFGEVGPSVCYADGIIYAMNEYATLVAIDVNDPSKTLWENDEILSDIPSPAAANGLLIVPASYGLIACYDAKTGEILWDHEFDNNIYSSPIIVGDNVYLMDTRGIMHIFKLDRESFKLVRDCPLGEDVVTTPAFADGRIYIRTDKNLYCIGK